MVNGWRRSYSAFLKGGNRPDFDSPSPSSSSMFTLLPRKFSTSSRLRGPCVLKAWILKVMLVLAKLQGESKAYFCVAWHYKTKAAICINFLI